MRHLPAPSECSAVTLRVGGAAFGQARPSNLDKVLDLEACDCLAVFKSSESKLFQGLTKACALLLMKVHKKLGVVRQGPFK